MRCSEFQERVHALMDCRKDPSSDPTLRVHAKSCTQCGVDLRAFQKLHRMFDTSTPLQPNAKSPGRRELWSRGGWALALSVAVCLALAFASGDQLGIGHSPSESLASNNIQNNIPTSELPESVEASVTREFDSVVDSTTSGVRSAAAESRGMSAVSSRDPLDITRPKELAVTGNIVQPMLGLTLMSKTNWKQIESWKMPFGVQVPTVEMGWMQEVAEEMQPVRQSVDNTLELILRSLATKAA